MVSETEEWLRFSEGLLANGFAPVHAVVFLTMDLVLPTWATTVYLLANYAYLTCHGIMRLIRERGHAKGGLFVFVLWYVILFPTLWFFALPARRILVYHGLTRILPNFLVRTWDYLQLDGPPQNDEGLNWALSRESLLLYGACVYVFTHRDIWLWALCLVLLVVITSLLLGRWESFDALLPQVLQTLFAGVLEELVVRRLSIQSLILRAFVFTVCRAIVKNYGSLDQLRVLEAQLVARFPDYIMHSWSRYQQSLLQGNAIPKFEYSPLGDNQFRLLILRRSRWFSSIIETSIVHQSIDLPLDYEAVSYRWGGSERTDEILIDGCRFSVTRSAFDLLLARRSLWRDRVIWITVDSVSALNASGPYEIDVEYGAIVTVPELWRGIYSFFRSVIDLCNEHAGRWPTENVVHERLWQVLIAGHIKYECPDPHFKDVFRSWIRFVDVLGQDLDGVVDKDTFEDYISPYLTDESFASYNTAVYEAVYGRCFGITTAGRLCLLPPLTCDGDIIFIPLGAETPFVIRRQPDKTELGCSTWELIGEAFVEGLMNGEAMGKEPEMSLVFG